MVAIDSSQGFLPARPQRRDVCIAGTQRIGGPLFEAQLLARSVEMQSRGHTRWLVADADAHVFVVNLLAALSTGASVVVPPNLQVGTINQLAFAYDAVAPAVLPFVPSPQQTPAHDAQQVRVPLAGIIDMYTSGSTGEPKRIRKTLGQFQAEIATLESLWGPELGDAVVLATAPHTHFYGLLFRLLWPLSAGRLFDTTLCSDPHLLMQRLALWPRAAVVSSPAQLSRMPELVDLPAQAVRPVRIFSSGGPLAAATAAAFRTAWGEAPTEVFGSTETGGIAWRRQGTDLAWTPMPGVRVQADDDTALVVQSDWLDNDQPWRMDDGVQILGDGRVVMNGRLDRTVKIEEKRVALPELEARLLVHPWLASVAATVVGTKRQRIGVVVVLKHGAPAVATSADRRLLVQSLRAHLASHFEAVVLPRHWRFVAALPYNERGKLTQADLAALFLPADDRALEPISA